MIRKTLIVVMFCFFTISLNISADVIYEYDDLHRLTRVVLDDGSVIEYSYDSAGNRVSKNVLPPVNDNKSTSKINKDNLKEVNNHESADANHDRQKKEVMTSK